MSRAILCASALFIAAAMMLRAEDRPPLWSLQPVVPPHAPHVQQNEWPRSRADVFILSELEKQGLQPSRDAGAPTLLRRLSFDLTGLPPSLEEIAEFEQQWAQNQEAALASAADRLLASPDFGARWGRHWLDVARYAESSGNSRNMAYVLAWRYRNWVIDAFNRNTPFDRFIRQQIAGDLLPAANAAEHDENALGTGFLTVGVKPLGEQDLVQYELNIADDQIDAVCRGFLAFTVSCARCHDHKFDPIPTNDYYALAGIFRSTAHLTGVETNNRHEEAEGMPLGADGKARVAAVKAHDAELASMTKEYTEVANRRQTMRTELTKAGIEPAKAIAQLDTMAPEMAEKVTMLISLDKSVEEWKERLKTMKEKAPLPPSFGMAAQEKPKPADSPLYFKGDVKSPRAPVPRGPLSAIALPFPAIAPGESGRRQLAEWITNPENPLTSRVIVNRVWQHVFGRGLVETPDDFGSMGAKPVNAALLDDLAWRFVQSGWNVKGLIRELVLSRTYRQVSAVTPESVALKSDPTNSLLWRMNRKPLEAEAVRDALLELGGHLDHTPLLGSPVATLAAPVTSQGRELGRNGLLNNIPDEGTKRSIYLPVLRAAANPAMQCFDVADPNLVTGRRRATIVPAQALYLMNSELVLIQAEALADSVLSSSAATLDERVTRVFRRCLTRPPTPAERATLRGVLASAPDDRATWSQICQTLIMTGEFRILE